MASLYYRAVAWENESVRGPGWPRTLGMDPHEVAGGLGGSLCRHVLKPLAREANHVGTLPGGSGEGISLGRRFKQGKEVQSPQ